MLGNWLSLLTKQIRSFLNWLKVYQSKPIQIRDQTQNRANVSTKLHHDSKSIKIKKVGLEQKNGKDL
ncbi:hypothetical protein M892_14435 [Vibrio campbellii ATCC BAA-1116]|uniref:Uncharacterized protein n=1 Tax=Vibrio campbellii (strain ATCC BAA-1116) TaxID=2902295 RepID=A7MZJ5_VIBC1|nr:hypothetical protein VIBHAR_03332 [Vibrio campbellii ATCC BAA-1116]AGU96834.1 hypothetical protein M892_14435 [Vibrio campbellii ATCC BAA-1116]